jgi:hypothetical protein
MRIQFINGNHITARNENTIWNETNHCWTSGYLQINRYEKPRKAKLSITIVKQKTIKDTIEVLIHELAHWLVFRITRTAKYNKYDRWIDKNL